MPQSERLTVLSTCARASTTAEAQFRVDYPNSKGRSAAIIVFDAPESPRVSEHCSQLNAEVYALDSKITVIPSITTEDGMILRSARGLQSTCQELLSETDLIVLVVTTPSNGNAIEVIAEAAARRNVMIAGLVIADNVTGETARRAMLLLRPHTPVLAVSSDPDYLSTMLLALRLEG